jgi:hypothetical protein
MEDRNLMLVMYPDAGSWHAEGAPVMCRKDEQQKLQPPKPLRDWRKARLTSILSFVMVAPLMTGCFILSKAALCSCLST